MKKTISIGLYLIFILAISCRQELDFNNTELYSYSIGDTLTSDFEITRNLGPYLSTAKYSKDSLLEVYTIGRHISYFHISLTGNEYKGAIDRYKVILGEPIKHYIKDTIHGVRLSHQIEHYSWYDKLDFTKYEVYQTLDSLRNGFVTISNDSIFESLKSKFIPNYNEIEEEIEFMTIE